MKKRILAMLLVVLLMVPWMTGSAVAYNEDMQLINEVLHSPDLGPGDLLAAGAQGWFMYSYDYDSADVVLVSSATSPASKSILVQEYVIIGDLLEFNDDAAVIYEDGTIIKGVREVFSDGERMTLFLDPTKHDVFHEMFVSWKMVRGAQDTKLLVYLDGQLGSGLWENVQDHHAESPYPVSRPASSRELLDVLYYVEEDEMVYPKPEMSLPNPYVTPTSSYTDVATTHWAFGNIEACRRKGLMQGVGDDRFSPEGTLTRAQVAQIVYNAYKDEFTGSGEMVFADDVAVGQWFYSAVDWLVRHGMAELSVPDQGQNGRAVNEGNFDPNAPATRAFIADVLYKVAQGKGVELPKTVDVLSFPDIGGLDASVQLAIGALQQSGVIGGYPNGTFVPDGTLTRCQMAKLIDVFTDISGL